MLKTTAAALVIATLDTTTASAKDWAGAYAGGSLSYASGTNDGVFPVAPTEPWDGDANAARIGAFAGYN
jgi:hypothetical protein